jgi:hypothetical protein
VQEEKQEKLPIDARLLSEAVIELNISRRSVGLYPPNHPIVRESIEKAFGHLKRLFELRGIITLGITEKGLVIDEYMLERKNPVFMDFASVMHSKGIVALTFSSGVGKDELAAFHEIITMKDAPQGKALLELAREKGIRHITMNLMDMTNLRFVEGALKDLSREDAIWEDYIYCLLDGRLPDDARQEVLSIPPGAVASMINDAPEEALNTESYDRVITSYLRRKGDARLSRESFDKFVAMVEGLRPELKRQFLSRSFGGGAVEMAEVEGVLSEMTSESFNRIAEIFSEHSSLLPETLRNLIDKLTEVKKGAGFGFDVMMPDAAVVHDIEFGDDLMRLFEEDHFRSYVKEDYKRDLEMMLRAPKAEAGELKHLMAECREDVIERALSEVMLEAIESEFIGEDNYLRLLSRLTEFSNMFAETGRFEEILEIYNAIYSHALKGRNYASDMIGYFFRSGPFIAKLIDAFRLWGRKDRDSAARLARALKHYIISPMLDALSEEPASSVRRFFLFVLSSLGKDVLPDAVRRLDDGRWYVSRNMIYLIRECGGKKYAGHVGRLAKHKNRRICMEAVRTLIHFKTPDAIPYLKMYLRSKDAALRADAVRLSGQYRVGEAVPLLAKLLQEKDMLGTESFYKIDIVKSLGEIGDPAAVKALVKVYGSKSLLYRGSLENLKLEIFRSLGNYPISTIMPLLELGSRSKDEEIRNISAALMEGGGMPAGKWNKGNA